MEAKAILRNARIAPRKVQIVLDLIRGKDYDVAMATVKHTPKAASEYLEKLLKSAAHNAENNHNMDKNNLYVAECYVCPGPIMKRIMPRAQGRAYRILKRTSHVTIVVILNQCIAKSTLFCKPAGVPILNHTDTKSVWIYFLSHSLPPLSAYSLSVLTTSSTGSEVFFALSACLLNFKTSVLGAYECFSRCAQ